MLSCPLDEPKINKEFPPGFILYLLFCTHCNHPMDPENSFGHFPHTNTVVLGVSCRHVVILLNLFYLFVDPFVSWLCFFAAPPVGIPRVPLGNPPSPGPPTASPGCTARRVEGLASCRTGGSKDRFSARWTWKQKGSSSNLVFTCTRAEGGWMLLEKMDLVHSKNKTHMWMWMALCSSM